MERHCFDHNFAACFVGCLKNMFPQGFQVVTDEICGKIVFSQEKPFEPADRICIRWNGVNSHEVFMLIKKLSRSLALFASVSWQGGDKLDLVTFKVRDSSPSGTRLSKTWSVRPDVSNDQITRSRRMLS